MHTRILRRLIVAVATAAALSVTLGTGTASPASPASPPGGVYTCAWIAANPESAAQAHVTCDPSVFKNAMTAQAAPPSPAQTMTPTVVPCASPYYVPNGARVGQGVFAWSDYFNTTYFAWKGIYSPANYTWYIQGADGINYVHASDFDTNWYDQPGLAYYTYRWGAQNHSTTAQQWRMCPTTGG